MNEQTNQSTNNLREASIAKSTAELRALFESQIQRLPSGNLDPYRQIIRPANNKPSITYLTPQGILALRKVGVSDIYPDPNLVNVTLRECDMESKNELVIFQDEGSFLERYRRQTPLRRAWEIDLETLYTRLEGDRGGNWELKAVEVLARERICLRRLIELKLGISPASVSRIFKLLREQGLVEVVQFIEGPGHPVDLLNLTLTGLQHAEKIGLAAKPAPERNATAILQQIVFLQRITIALLERYPESKITRVYGDLSVPKLQTLLGEIIPDIVWNLDGHSHFIEGESGKYDYKRLKGKLDKYLSGRVGEVRIVAREAKAPTHQHIRQWLHERRKEPINPETDAPLFRILFTTLEQLQGATPESQVWQVFEYQKGLLV